MTKQLFQCKYTLILLTDSLAPAKIHRKSKHFSLIIGCWNIQWNVQVHISVDISTWNKQAYRRLSETSEQAYLCVWCVQDDKREGAKYTILQLANKNVVSHDRCHVYNQESAVFVDLFCDAIPSQYTTIEQDIPQFIEDKPWISRAIFKTAAPRCGFYILWRQPGKFLALLNFLCYFWMVPNLKITQKIPCFIGSSSRIFHVMPAWCYVASLQYRCTTTGQQFSSFMLDILETIRAVIFQYSDATAPNLCRYLTFWMLILKRLNRITRRFEAGRGRVLMGALDSIFP